MQGRGKRFHARFCLLFFLFTDTGQTAGKIAGYYLAFRYSSFCYLFGIWLQADFPETAFQGVNVVRIKVMKI